MAAAIGDCPIRWHELNAGADALPSSCAQARRAARAPPRTCRAGRARRLRRLLFCRRSGHLPSRNSSGAARAPRFFLRFVHAQTRVSNRYQLEKLQAFDQGAVGSEPCMCFSAAPFFAVSSRLAESPAAAGGPTRLRGGPVPCAISRREALRLCAGRTRMIRARSMGARWARGRAGGRAVGRGARSGGAGAQWAESAVRQIAASATRGVGAAPPC